MATPANRNGCHNRPRPVAGVTWYWAQDGWTYLDTVDGQSRLPRMIKVYHVMSTECRTDASASSKDCKNCQHAPHIATTTTP